MSHIPVYGLNGLGETELGRVCGLYEPHSRSRAFNRYAAKIKNPKYRQAVIARHDNELAGLTGIYNVSYNNITTGNGSSEDFTNLKKIKVLFFLNDHDFNAYRFAKIIMPYVKDIDENGDYIFDNLEIAKAAAEAEEKFFDYVESPASTDYGIDQQLGALDGWLKKLWNVTKNATKAIGKAIGKSVTVPVKAAVQATKAGVNITKAGIQAIGGNTAAAKASMKKAWKQARESALNPLKESWNITKDLTKYTVIDPTTFTAKTTYDVFRSTVKVAGKVFKVLFLKINPVTVAMRGALRGVLALNFIGLASRLNVGLMTAEQAAQQGYSTQAWEKAKKAVEKLVKIFKKMGGNAEKVLKSVVTGAAKKPLFKKDIKANTKVNLPDNDGEGEASLAAAAEVAAMVATVIGIITSLWQLVASVVKAVNERKANKTAAEKQKEYEQRIQQMYNEYAHDENGNFYTDDEGNLMTWDEYEAYLKEQKETEQKRKKILIISGIAAAGMVALMLSKN